MLVFVRDREIGPTAAHLRSHLYFKRDDMDHINLQAVDDVSQHVFYPHPFTLNERMGQINLQAVNDVSQHVLDPPPPVL